MSENDNQIEPEPEPAQARVQPWWGRLLVGRKPIWTLVRLAVAVPLILVVFRTCLLPIRVTGHSMEPTYRDGRVNFLNLLAYHRRPPRRGDVIGIRLEGRRMILLKRVLGLPGEKFWLRNGVVWINGKPLEEPHAKGHDIPSMRSPVQLGPEEYFVVGDNRDVTEYGIIERSEIFGKALF